MVVLVLVAAQYFDILNATGRTDGFWIYGICRFVY